VFGVLEVVLHCGSQVAQSSFGLGPEDTFESVVSLDVDVSREKSENSVRVGGRLKMTGETEITSCVLQYS
jgi:hypothetical protein